MMKSVATVSIEKMPLQRGQCNSSCLRRAENRNADELAALYGIE
jgi:hypothetical protein